MSSHSEYFIQSYRPEVLQIIKLDNMYYFTSFKILLHVLVIGICFLQEVQLTFIKDKKDNIIHAAQCGGNVDGDSNSIIYPGPGFTLQPGELCIWSVHLSTTTDFKFNFTSFNVNSNDDTCKNGGVRIYSLTNLVPSGAIQGYTFCDSKPADSTFYLGNNVAVVVLYTGTGNINSGSGFQLNWEGSAYDPLRTKHLSNFATAPQGSIRYPTFGQYEANLAATWLVALGQETQTSNVDIILSSIDLESCSNSQDRCSCDALLLYEISQDGILNETDRFCGEMSSAILSNLQTHFLLAFFTDFETKPGGGTGLIGNYYPTDSSASPPTTPPSTAKTTTEEPGDQIISTNCGDTLSLVGNQKGKISYKPGELYNVNERCVWIIRIRNAISINFDLVQSGFDQSSIIDGISISSFTRSDPPLLDTKLLRNESLVTLNGSVATVTFQSDATTKGTGFELNFEATGFSRPNISFYSKDFISSSPNGSISHPLNGGNYTDTELSTFIIGPPGFSVDSSSTMHVTWILNDLGTNCYDYVILFKYYTDSGWSQYDLYCATSPKVTSHTDLLLYVFLSSSSGVSTGFSFDWYVD